MITQTVAATNAWKASDRTLDAVVTVVSTDYHTTDLASITYDGGAFTGDTLGIGSNYENNITVTFAHLVEGFVQGQLVTAKIGIKLPDGTFEYSSLGVFVISDDIGMDRNGDVTTIKCYDLMCLLEGTYTSKLIYPAKVTDVIAEIANLAGVPLNTSDIARLPAQTNLIKAISGQTYRDAIGWLAQLYAGFALFDRDGKLTIRTITDTDYAIDASQYEQGGLTKNEAAYTIGGIQCQVTTTTTDSDGNSTDSTVTLQSGSSTGSQIQLTNNIMTQARLDAIWTLIKNVNFYPFSLNWFGNPAIEAGDWFALLDTKGNRFNVPNSSYQMTFDGSFSSVSSAQQTATSSSTYSYGGDITKAISNLQKVTAGLNAYTHIAYADSATGSGFSQDPTGKSYIGFYSDSNSADSTDPTLYNWSLIQGAASYVHIAYADSSSGTGLSQDPTNKKYIGTYSDSTADDSSDPTKYTWMLFVGQDGATGAQGIPGAKGADGQTSYFHIAYADSSDGKTNFSVDTAGTRQYIGTYSDFTSADSTDPTKYTWQLTKGATGTTGATGAPGTNGTNGTDGKTSYFHIAYADSADGKTNFSTSIAGTRLYIGTYSDFTLAGSTDPSMYVWQLTKGNTGAAGQDITAISYGTTTPTNPKENDLWYKQNGNSIELWIYHNGGWVLDLDNALGTRITNEATAKMQDAEDYTDDTAKNLISELSSVNKIVNSEFDTDTAQKNVVESSTTVPTSNSKGYADQTIVGRNLLRNTSAFANTDHWSNSGGGSSLAIVSHAFYQSGQGKLLKLSTSGTTEVFLMSEHFSVQAGESYTFQLKAFNNSNVASMDFFALGRPTGSTSDYTKVVASKLSMQPSISGIGTFTFSFTVPDGIGELYIRIDNNGSKVSGSSADLYVAEMKLEVGSLTPYIKAPEDLAIANWQDTIVHDPVDGTYVVSGTTSTKASTVQVKNSAGTIVASQDLSQPKNSDQIFTQGSFSVVTHDNDDGTGTASIATPTAGTSLAVTDELNKLIFSNANMGIPNKALDSEMLKGIGGDSSTTQFWGNNANDITIKTAIYNGHNVLDIKRTSSSAGSNSIAFSADIPASAGDVWSWSMLYRVLSDVSFGASNIVHLDWRKSDNSGISFSASVPLSSGQTVWKTIQQAASIAPANTGVLRLRIEIGTTGHIQIALPTLTQTASPIDYVADTVDVTKWLATLPADGKAYKATINASTILNFNMPTAIDRYSYDFTFPAIQGNYNLVLPEGTYPFTVKQQVFPLTINGYTVSANGTVSGTAPTNTATVYVIGSNGSSYSTAVKADKTFAIAVNTDGSTYTIHSEYTQSYTGLTDWHDSDPNLPAAAYTLASELVATSKVIEISNTTIYADDIPVFANVIVSLGGQFKLISGSATLQMAFFKNDGTGLGVQTTAISAGVWTAISLLKQTTPANTDYVRVSIIASSGTVRISQPLFVLASALPPYTAGIGISGKGVLGLFNNNYALGLFKNSGMIISGINGNTDGMRLTGKTISLDGDVVATGDFWANQINAIKINAANIIAGIIDADIVHIINLDVSSIVGDITQFINSNWADPYGNNISIDGSEIALYDNERNYEMRITAKSLLLSNLNNGAWTKIQNGYIEMTAAVPSGSIESVGGLSVGVNLVDERLNGIYLVGNSYGMGGSAHNGSSDDYWAADDVGIAYRNGSDENFGTALRYNISSNIMHIYAPINTHGANFSIDGAQETFNFTWAAWSDIGSGWKFPAIHSQGSGALGGIAIGGAHVYAFGTGARQTLA